MWSPRDNWEECFREHAHSCSGNVDLLCHPIFFESATGTLELVSVTREALEASVRPLFSTSAAWTFRGRGPKYKCLFKTDTKCWTRGRAA